MRPARSSIVQIPTECQHDLMWSFQPVFYLMQILGIDLNVSQQLRSKLQRRGFLTLKIFMLVYSMAANLVRYLRIVTEDRKKILFWVNVLHQNTTAWTSFFIASMFVTKHIFKWKPLWIKVQKMERFMNFTSFVCQLRKSIMSTSAVGISFFLVVKTLF